jgi:hypothetical protein
VPNGFDISDRRGATSNGQRSQQQVFQETLRKAGVKGSINIQRAREESRKQLPLGDPRLKDAAIYEHLASRKLATGGGTQMRRTGGIGSGMSLQMATSRPRDPMWYWKQNNIPINFTKPEELQRIREFCNTPDAPIMMADGTSKPIGEVVVGDQVMGWTYRITWNGGMHRMYGPSKVLATSVREAPNVVQLNMASGAALKCTRDHRWHNPYFTRPQGESGIYPIDFTAKVKRQSDEYVQAKVGTELLAPTNIRQVYNPGNLFTSVFAGQQSISDQTMDKVISIDDIGMAEVVSLQTATGNYIAWGYCSKNCRLLYATHPIVSACIDVYSKLPMQGAHFECKDPQLVDFYSELFLDQLDYEEHLLKLGRQYWLSGESWSLGGWNESLGIWQEDELVNPDDVEVERNLFLSEPRYMMKLPEDLRKILTTRQPHWQFVKLMDQFPELLSFAQEDARLPVSNIVLKQMKFEADDFSNRGIPILMRAMRTLIQEEMLNSALDSIADRLYTPLILAKLGAKASDLGTETPWVPSQEDMDEFNAALDAAMAADFRVLTYHWGLEMESVFGKENVPDLSNDFDRIVERILMVFGLSQTMLTGASAGETYAADALNRDVVTQLLSHYQKMQYRFVQSRAEIVAEAQGHFDYEVRGGKRYLITQDEWVIDEETGKGHLEEIPKLLVPELKFKILNLSDEEQERQFVESLAEAGVPVPYRARMQSAGIDFDESLEQRKAEKVALAVAEQEARRDTYRALRKAGLPISDDLKNDFAPVAIQPGQVPMMPGTDEPITDLGAQMEIPNLAPSPDDQEAEDEESQGIDPATGQPMDPNQGQDVDEGGEPSNRPEESDEERKDMPKKAAGLSKEAVAHNAAFQRFGRTEILAATERHWTPPDNSQEVELLFDESGQPIVDEVGEQAKRALLGNYQPAGRYGDPHHVGMRRRIAIPEQLKAPTEDQDSE